METTIHQTTAVEYELEIHATADEIEPRLNKALRQQGQKMDVKGFRQGKVPLGLVKKMHGDAIGYQVAEEFVQEAFEEAMDERDDIEPLGQPTLVELDYEIDSDLRATIRFGVRPEVELKDLSDVEIPVLTHEVTDEDVEEEIEKLRTREADLMPLDSEEAATETDYVDIDLQRIDPSTDTPIIGDKEEGLTFFLDDERLKDELREALVGTQAGDTFRVRLPQDATPQQGGQEDAEDRLYEVAVNDVKRRDLPPVDAEFVRRISDGEMDDPDAFRQEVRDQLEKAYDDQSQEMVRGEIIDQMIDLHGIQVPESVVERYLDSFVNQVRQENDGDLPDDFDETAFRQRNRDDAERQGRWMLIRDQIVEENDLEVTDEDLQAFFREQSDNEVSVAQLEQFYNSMPRMMERVKQQILSDKVFDWLLDRFDVQEKSREEFQDLMEERHRRKQALAGGGGHPHPH